MTHVLQLLRKEAILKEADLPETPSLSYSSTATTGYSLSNLATTTVNSAFNSQYIDIGQVARTLDRYRLPESITNIPTEAKKMGARLISYFVVDPDVNLHKNFPEKAVLTSGQRMVAGDDKAFLLDVAAELADPLAKHNQTLSGLTWENDKGESKAFRARKLSDLDVVIAVIKCY